MAVVQLYQGQQVRQTGTNQNIGVHASAESFGAGRARDLGRVAQGVMDVSELLLERQKKADAAQARNLLNQAEMESQEAMRQGVYARKGLDADGADEVAKQSMDQIRKKYLALAKNSRQKELFSASFDPNVQSNILHAATHRDREMERGNLASMDAENTLATKRAVTYRDTPDEIAKAEFTITKNTLKANAGMGANAKLKADDAVREMHRSVLTEHLAAGDDAKALAHIEKYGDRIPKDMAEKVQNNIAFRQQQGAVLEMVKGGKSETEIAEYVMGAVKDPGKADDLVRYAATISRVRRDQANAAKVAKVDGFWKEFYAESTPEGKLGVLNRHKGGLGHEDIEKAETRIIRGREVERNPDLNLYREIGALNGSELLNRVQAPGVYDSVRESLGGDKSPYWKEIENRIVEAGGGKVKPEDKEKVANELSDSTRNHYSFDAAWVAAGNKINDKDGKYDAAKSKFLLALEADTADLIRSNGGKPLTLDDKRGLLARRLVYGKIASAAADGFAYEARNSKDFEASIPQAVKNAVPNAEVQYDTSTGNFGAFINGGRALQAVSPDGKLIGNPIPLSAAEVAAREKKKTEEDNREARALAESELGAMREDKKVGMFGDLPFIGEGF